MICENCKCTEIKTRRNYPHGKKSKATVTMFCKKCGSTNIGSNRAGNIKRKWRKH